MSEFKQLMANTWSKFVEGVKKFFLIILITIVAGSVLYIWAMGWTYSEGSRSGFLVKTSRKGVVFKTFEGQLNLGGFQVKDDNTAISSIWEFSVAKKDFYKQLQQFEGKHVKLYYKQRYKAMPWQGKTDYFVYNVEPVQ